MDPPCVNAGGSCLCLVYCPVRHRHPGQGGGCVAERGPRVFQGAEPKAAA